MRLVIAASLAALALLAPAAQAQDPSGISLVANSAGTVPFQGEGSFPVTLTVGCALVLQAAADDFTATVSAVGAPSWLTLDDAAVSIDPTGCLAGMGETPVSADVPFSVAADAPGVEPLSVNLTATVAGTTSDPASAAFTVAYESNYTVVADAQFPLTLTTPEVKFNVTATQASNARSMIMMEGVTVSAGSFAGLPSTVYESAAGSPASKTFEVTFKAPEGEWTNATVTFQAFGHYLLTSGEAGEYSPAQTYTFQFVNGGTPATDGDGDGKESPAPVAAFTALGLLGLAAALRRKAA